MEYRSPLDNVFSFISGLPQGHDKPVKHALYNALALFALVLCCVAVYALHVILTPFIKPLLWALLVGSVLHPFKCSLARRFRSWFDSLEESGTPILIGLFVVPVNILDDMSEFIGSRLLKYIRHIIAIAIAIPTLLVTYYYTPRICICLVWKVASWSHLLISLIINNSTTTTIVIILLGYIAVLYTVWSPENNKRFHWASICMWLILSCFLSHQCGSSFQTPIFIALQIIFLAGFIYEVRYIQEEMLSEGHDLSLLEAMAIAFQTRDVKKIKLCEEVENNAKAMIEKSENKDVIDAAGDKNTQIQEVEPSIQADKPIISAKKSEPKKDPWALDLFEENSQKEVAKLQSDVSLEDLNKSKFLVCKQPAQTSSSLSDLHRKYKYRRSNSQPYVSNLRSRSSLSLFNIKSSTFDATKNSEKVSGQSLGSDFYIYSLLWMCGVTFMWKNLMMIPIFIIPVLIYLIKHVGNYLGVWNLTYRHFYNLFNVVNEWCIERYDAFIPLPIRGLYKVIGQINKSVKSVVKESIDTVASSVVILALLVFVVCASIFVAIQIYTEAIMLVQMTSNVINHTVVQNPELRQILPPSFDDTVDSILDNAYQYGREGISTLVKSIMNDVDSAKSAKLERQVLELWDRLYQSWMTAENSNGPKVTSEAVENSWQAFLDDIQKSPEMFNINGITDFVKQNIGTFMSLLESIWLILKGNISLFMSSFSAFLSILLGGGTAVLNFILNVIVFLTTLFYLLSSSGDLYKPVEFLTNFSPSGSRVGLALEGAISGVFTATFKLAAFYGLWTWLIHNWFNVKIVYLPSALATILGAVPFLGTYWACVPAVLDLWLAQDKGFQALLFAGFQFLPTSVVDTTIYNEIQGGGHPYLTGLAIAGGIFCLGVEGAILGPLLLCALYVIIDLSSNLFKDSPSEVPLNIPSLTRHVELH